MTQLLNVDQAAQALAVSRDFIYKAVERRAIEHFKIGSRLRFSEAQLQAYVSRSAVPAERASA